MMICCIIYNNLQINQVDGNGNSLSYNEFRFHGCLNPIHEPSFRPKYFLDYSHKICIKRFQLKTWKLEPYTTQHFMSQYCIMWFETQSNLNASPCSRPLCAVSVHFSLALHCCRNGAKRLSRKRSATPVRGSEGHYREHRAASVEDVTLCRGATNTGGALPDAEMCTRAAWVNKSKHL